MAKLKWNSIPDMIGWNRLKSLRKERNLSQLEVAAGAGVSLTVVYYLELGYEERTTDKTRQKLADFFEVDMDDLFPVEMIGNQPAKKYLEKIKKGTGQPAVKK